MNLPNTQTFPFIRLNYNLNLIFHTLLKWHLTEHTESGE